MTADPTATNGQSPASAHYQRPGWFTRNLFNRLIAGLTRGGVSVAGSRVLRIRGRKSGQLRSTPVNVLTLDGTRYLVAPRGITDWVRNLRVAGAGELVVGRRVETFTATELGRQSQDPNRDAELSREAASATTDGRATDQLVVTVLRAYLRRWKWEVGQFFGGVGPDSTDAELLAIAPQHPIFRITTLTR